MKKPFFAFALIALAGGTALAQNISTRYGALTINADNLLLFKGKPVQSRVEGNNNLSVLNKFQMRGKDVVLVRDNGGTACPAMYHFVTVTKTGAKATKAFGTCTDLTKVSWKGETVTVDMPGFTGPFATKAELDEFMKTRHIFTFKNGTVWEKIVPPKNVGPFDPFTFYIPVDMPARFANLQSFALMKGQPKDKRSNAFANLVSNREQDKNFVFREVHLTPHTLAFNTGINGGESFKFEGKFLYGGDLRRFSAGDSDNPLPVLEGTLRRFFNGKQTDVTPIQFFVQNAVS